METLPLDANRWIDNEPEPMPLTAGVLTVAVHAVFAAVLLLNMSWQQKIQPHASVKLWESMPTSTAKTPKRSKPKPAPPPPASKPARDPVVAPAREPVMAPAREAIAAPAPKPMTVKMEPAPAPPPQVDVTQPSPPTPAPPRADLAAPTRERKPDQPAPQAQNRVSAEPPPSLAPAPLEAQAAPQPNVDIKELKRQRALALAQLLREEEAARLDNTLDQEREARIVEYRERLEERERKLAQELGEIRAAAQQRQDEQEAKAAMEAAGRQVTDDYRARISAKIRQRVILPPDLRGNPEAIYEVSLLPDGSVTQVRLLQTSGVATYDAAVERAILAAQPLPVPEEPALFQANFRNLHLSFRPKE